MNKLHILCVLSAALVIAGMVADARRDIAAQAHCGKSGQAMVIVNGSRACATIEEELKP